MTGPALTLDSSPELTDHIYLSSSQALAPLGVDREALRAAVASPTYRGPLAPDLWIGTHPGWSGRRIARGAQPPAQPAILLTTHQFAERVGLKYLTIKAYRRDGRLIRPSAFIDNRPGWFEDSADLWYADRPAYAAISAPHTYIPVSARRYLRLSDAAALRHQSHNALLQRHRAGTLRTPDAYFGSTPAWLPESIPLLEHPATARPGPPARYYLKVEIAALYDISPGAISHAIRAGRWPEADAVCGRTSGWRLATVEATRGPVIRSDALQ